MNNEEEINCLLITGVGHSGTRLLVNMLSHHPNIDVPFGILNNVKEFYPLHQFFVNSMDNTSLHSEKYEIDNNELKFIIESYISEVDCTKNYFVIKLPYYPLNCLNFFYKFFEGNIKFLYTKRPKEKIVKSFLRRNEDRLYFSDPQELNRQVKKLNADRRRRFLTQLNNSNKNNRDYFYELVNHSNEMKKRWNGQNPEDEFLDIKIEKFATNSSYISNILQELDLPQKYIDEMKGEVNESRLIGGLLQNVIDYVKRFVKHNFIKKNLK